MRLPHEEVMAFFRDLAGIVGEERARQVMEAFDGQTFPAFRSFEIAEAVEEARPLLAKGRPVDDVARYVGLGRTTLYRMIHKDRNVRTRSDVASRRRRK